MVVFRASKARLQETFGVPRSGLELEGPIRVNPAAVALAVFRQVAPLGDITVRFCRSSGNKRTIGG